MTELDAPARPGADIVTAAVALVGGCLLLLWLIVRAPFGLPSADIPTLEAYAARPAAVATADGVLVLQSPAQIAVVNHEARAKSVTITVTATGLCGDEPLSVSLGGSTATLAPGMTAAVSTRGVSVPPFGRTTVDLTITGVGCPLPSSVERPAMARLDAVTAEPTA